MELQVSLEFNFDVLHLSTDTYTQQQGIAGVFFPEKLTEQFKVPLGKNGRKQDLMGQMFLYGMGMIILAGMHSIVRRTGNKAVDDAFYLSTIFTCVLFFARAYTNLQKSEKLGFDKTGSTLNLASSFVIGVGAALLWREGGMQIPEVNMSAFSFDSAMDQFNVFLCVTSGYFAITQSVFAEKMMKDMKVSEFYNNTQQYLGKAITQFLGGANIVVVATTIAAVSSGNSAFQYAMCRLNWVTCALYGLGFTASYFRREEEEAPKEFLKALSMYRILSVVGVLVAARAMLSVDTA